MVMETRAIKNLCQLRDEELFHVVSTGLDHVLEVVNRLVRSVRRLPGSGKFYTKSIHSHAAHILGSIAEEEASKFFILMDFVRCPLSLKSERTRQLDYFYSHLAKGIYAEYYGWHLANFKEGERIINQMREQYYLDGPMDIDWIFYNRTLSQREDKFYVNYVKEDEGECYWQYPRNEDYVIGYSTGAVIRTANAIHQVGLTSPEGLSVTAEIWRKFEITSELTIGKLEKHNKRTLETLEKRGFLKKTPDENLTNVMQRWLFPLYSLDLSVKKVKKSKLREIQEQWVPEL